MLAEGKRMEGCTMSSIPFRVQVSPLDLEVPPEALKRRGAISFGSTESYIQINLPRFERRGGISFDRKDKNAIYVRMLGDMRLKGNPEQNKEKRRTSLTESEVKLLEGLSAKNYKARWSTRFRTVHKRHRKKCTGTTVSSENQSLLDKHYSIQAQCMLNTVGAWDLNIFTLDLLTCGRPLFHVALHLFQYYDLINTFNLDVIKLLRTFSQIEDGYHDNNPYHNAVHAADVTQAMHCYLQEQQLVGAIPSLEVMTSLLAAMTHDLDHPGVNQAFLIATSNHLASLYQNTSVLENHHWRTAVGVLHETGVFKHLPQEKWQEIEWQIKSLILATDITRQQEFLSRFKKYLSSDDFNYRNNPEHRHFMLQIALKCADISNPCREWNLSRQWSERVCDEFFRQGDLERNIHIPVTPMCNRQTTTVAKIQAGFMQFVVHPLFSEWYRFLPSKLSAEMVENIAKNKKKWQSVIQEEQEKQLLEEKNEEEDVNSSNEEDKIGSDIEDEMSDTVEEARLPLTFTHLVDNDDENSLAPGSRRGSCRSLSPLREISENGWCPEQRRHSMPPACLRREVTCVTIKRDSLPLNQYHRRRSLPTAVIVHTTSLDKLSGRFSGLATSRNSVGGKSISMEELLARPKISNLTMSYEASRLASGLSDVTQYRSQGGSVRFKNILQVSQIPVSVTEPRNLDQVTSEKENIPLNPNSGHVINKEPFQTLPSDVAFAQNSEKSSVSTSFTPHSHEALNCVDKHNVQTPKPPVVVVGETNLSEPEPTDICSNALDRVNLIGNPQEDNSLLNLGISRSLNSTIKPTSLSQ